MNRLIHLLLDNFFKAFIVVLTFSLFKRAVSESLKQFDLLLSNRIVDQMVVKEFQQKVYYRVIKKNLRLKCFFIMESQLHIT